jgi:hypothetical protein
VSDRNGEFDVTHAFATDFLLGYLYAATVAYDAFVTDTFIFTAMAFPVASGSENLFAEKTVPLRLVCTIVDCLRFGNLTIGALLDGLR